MVLPPLLSPYRRMGADNVPDHGDLYCNPEVGCPDAAEAEVDKRDNDDAAEAAVVDKRDEDYDCFDCCFDVDC